MSNILERPKNDWAKVIYVLMKSQPAGVNLLKVLTKFDQSFYKFQSRVGELIKLYNHDLKINVTSVPFKSEITGKKGSTSWYNPLCPPSKLLEYYHLINAGGLNGALKSEKQNIQNESNN